jgi:hypothetical protein
VLRIVITLKNPWPQLGLNLRTLGPMAGTLSTTPLRQLSIPYLPVTDTVAMSSVCYAVIDDSSLSAGKPI